MSDLQLEQVKDIVYTFAGLVNIEDSYLCESIIKRISDMKEEDAIDYIIVALNDLVESGRLSKEEVFSKINLLTELSDKYKTKESLLERLSWLKEMNLLHPKMPLSENHRLVLEVFDTFNELIGLNYDTYYTGGLMGYLATNHPLVRYHSDIDMFINEEQLESLYELVEKSDNFEFINNMDHKEKNGHEFKIQYKGTTMSIGLFLFERTPNNDIIIKNYYHKNNNFDEELLVDEQYLPYEYANLVFTNNVGEHNGIPYRMQSLENIYRAKNGSRPKDRYDATIIERSINQRTLEELNDLHQNTETIGTNAENSIVKKMESMIHDIKDTNSSRSNKSI